MASYMLLVLVPSSTEDIEEKVTELIEPYSKWIKLPPYKEYLRQWEIDQVRWRHQLASDALEQIVGKMKEAGDEEVGLDEQGIYRITTHNPLGRWDGWRIGGVWDGYIQRKRRSDGQVGYNLGEEHEQLHNNICLVSRLPRFFTVYELITPDGVWHSWGEWSKPGGFSSFNHMMELNEIAEQYADHIAVCLECHF